VTSWPSSEGRPRPEQRTLAREALSRRQAITVQLADLETQHATIVDQEQKLTDTAQRLQVEVEAFRTKKETIKATYTALRRRRTSLNPSAGSRRRW